MSNNANVKTRLLAFIRLRGEVNQQELTHINNALEVEPGQQIHHTILNRYLDELEMEGHITREDLTIGKKTFKMIRPT